MNSSVISKLAIPLPECRVAWTYVECQNVLNRQYQVFVELDPSRPEPLYRQLRAAITEAIEAGRFAAGELLPSSRALAADLGLSRNTVNMAYQELMAEGFLESIPRVGYAVNRRIEYESTGSDVRLSDGVLLQD